MKFHLSHYILHAVGLGALIPIILLTSTTDTIQSHGGPLTSKHELAFGGMRSHWTGGGMDYKFDGTFPANWKSYINQAAAHMKSNTFAVKLSESATSNNTISIGHWPVRLGAANSVFGADTCDFSGVAGGDVACVYPLTSDNELDIRIPLNTANNLERTAVVFDQVDVYEGTPPVVVPEWTENNGSMLKQVAAHEFGHTLGFFLHLTGSADVMKPGSGKYNLSTDDKWNLNRLYMYTTDAAGCMTEIDLSESAFNNAGGKMYPAGGNGILYGGSTICPSTAYNGLAHYFKLDASDPDDPRSGGPGVPGVDKFKP